MSSTPDKSISLLIETMQNPDVFDHPVTDVQLLETHISWVLLTGDYAYKIKKPVNLGFVNFTTLNKREFYCHEEIRLNRRLAQELYLEVVPITGSSENPKINGTTTPIEYAVKMKQFPQEALLSHLLHHEALLPRHIDNLAFKVAEFHQQVEIAPPDSCFGTPERVDEVVQENFRHLINSEIHTGDLKTKIELLQQWSHQEFNQLAELFTQRKEQGFIRECHGDMHLGNMILLNDEVTLFDCIEFNENFRWIDVLSEIAFCKMDLEYRGFPELSSRFLNAYLEQSGDYEGIPLIRFYLVYRAMVRAKVAAIRISQSGTSDTEKLPIQAECQGYLDLAEKYIKPLKPFLLITHGFSGSGKTYTTQQLVDGLQAIRLRSDVERKRLHGLKSLQSSHSADTGDIYSADSTENTYHRLAQLAQILLEAGHSVIVDATFLKHDFREKYKTLAEELKAPFAILDFQIAEEILKKRIRKRSLDASEANLTILKQQIQSHDPILEVESEHLISIDEQKQAEVEGDEKNDVVELVNSYLDHLIDA